jgi:competence protein ComEC
VKIGRGQDERVSGQSVSGRRWSVRQFSDLGTVGLAAATALGAWLALPVPVWPAALVAVLALLARRPALVLLAAAGLASGLAAQAVRGARPADQGSFTGRATLANDPISAGGAVRVEVRADGHHFEVWARGSAGATLRSRAAGQVIDLAGGVTPRAAGDHWAEQRHVVGSINAERIDLRTEGSLPVRLANAVRGVVLRGGDGLPGDDRALYGGFVLGDTRGQSAALADDFRGAGLGHLLVVSGENVAFVLAVASPVLGRLGLRARWVSTVGILGAFALMTRFEPSVLRATVMAGIAVTAWAAGRPLSGLRSLALCVTALLLVDPLLVGALGFQLSLAATAGILLLARPIAHHLPLPAGLASVLGVTLAAQVAVAPLLVGLPGGLPVAAVPANLLAEPAAGVIMAWGLTCGVVAGLAGGALKAVLQLPVRALLWWVAAVARSGAAAPLGQVSLLLLVGLVGAGGAAVITGRAGRPRLSVALWALVAVMLAMPLLTRDDPPARVDLAGSGVLWRTHGRSDLGGGSAVVVLVLGSGARPVDVLAGLRRSGVDRVALLISPTNTRSADSLVSAVRARVHVDHVWAPVRDEGADGASRSGSRSASAGITGAEAPPPVGGGMDLDGLHLVVTAVTPKLEVEASLDGERAAGRGVGSPGAPLARSPPFRRDPSRPRHGHPQPHPRLVLRQGRVLRLRRLLGQG